MRGAGVLRKPTTARPFDSRTEARTSPPSCPSLLLGPPAGRLPPKAQQGSLRDVVHRRQLPKFQRSTEKDKKWI